MKPVYRTILQLTIISRVIAIRLENIINSLPTDISADIKNVMLEMFPKYSEDFTMPDMEGVNISDIQSIINVNQTGRGSLMNTAPTASMPKSVTMANKPVTITNTPVMITNKLITITNKPLIITKKPMSLTDKSVPKADIPKKKQNKLIKRSGNTNTIGTTLPNKGATTPKPAEEKDGTSARLPIPPPGMAIPIPMPMPMPMAIPFFARVPVMMPMRSYFEPVIHDHPPLYMIKEMIENDEKKCKKHKHSKENVSVSKTGTDTETDTSSEYIDLGKEYYDGVIHIHKNRE